MHLRKINSLSYIVSAAIHLLLLILFYFITFEPDIPKDDFITLGFGSSGEGLMPGNSGVVEEVSEPEKSEEKAEEKSEEKKDVEVPIVKNLDEDNIAVNKKDDKKEKEKPKESEDSKNQGDNKTGDEGTSGFQLDFGTFGKRKIYNFNLPEYPDGVYKEIDIKLRFTIFPDGSVGKISPLVKADTRLENAAINSLRLWRFEPLPKNQKSEQTAFITFPYRLK